MSGYITFEERLEIESMIFQRCTLEKTVYTIDPSDFDEDTNITFTKINGDIEEQAKYKQMNLDMFEFVNKIYTSISNEGKYSIADFAIDTTNEKLLTRNWMFWEDDNKEVSENKNETTKTGTSTDINNTTIHKITLSSFPLYLYAQDGTFLAIPDFAPDLVSLSIYTFCERGRLCAASTIQFHVNSEITKKCRIANIYWLCGSLLCGNRRCISLSISPFRETLHTLDHRKIRGKFIASP